MVLSEVSEPRFIPHFSQLFVFAPRADDRFLRSVRRALSAVRRFPFVRFPNRAGGSLETHEMRGHVAGRREAGLLILAAV